MYLLLQAATNDAIKILEQSQTVSDLVRKGWDESWVFIIKSELFAYITAIGALVGFMFFGLWFLKWLRGLVDGNYSSRTLTEFVAPLIIVFLLGNPNNYGSYYGQLILDARDLSYGISDKGMELLSTSFQETHKIQLDQVIKGAGVKGTAQLVANSAVQQCSILTDSEKRNQCFNSASQQLWNLLEPYFGGTIKHNWAQSLYKNLSRKIKKAWGPDSANYQAWDRALSQLSYMVNRSTTAIAIEAMFIIGTAFLWGLEIAGILTAVMGPWYLGLSLLPTEKKAILDWIQMMLGIWLTKFCYSLVLGITAILVLNTGPDSPPQILPLVSAFIGPIISIWVGKGGGIGIVSGTARIGSTVLGGV